MALGLKAIPNPFREPTQIVLPESQSSCQMRLYYATGRLVKSQTASGQRIEMQRAGLPAGVYMLQVSGEGGKLLGRMLLVAE